MLLQVSFKRLAPVCIHAYIVREHFMLVSIEPQTFYCVQSFDSISMHQQCLIQLIATQQVTFMLVQSCTSISALLQYQVKWALLRDRSFGIDCPQFDIRLLCLLQKLCAQVLFGLQSMLNLLEKACSIVQST